MSDNHSFVGLDVDKATIAIAVAEQGRAGDVRYIGSFSNKPASIISQLKRLAEQYSLHVATILRRSKLVSDGSVVSGSSNLGI